MDSPSGRLKRGEGRRGKSTGRRSDARKPRLMIHEKHTHPYLRVIPSYVKDVEPWRHTAQWRCC